MIWIPRLLPLMEPSPPQVRRLPFGASRHHRRRLAAIGGLLLLWAGSTSIARAQSTDDIDIRVEGSVPKIQIAIPAAWHSGAGPEHAKELVETLRADLDFTGFFQIVEPRLYGLVEQTQNGPLLHEDWSAVGAQQVTHLDLRIQAGRIDLSARVFDNASRSLLLGRRYGGRTELVRLVAHQLADDLVKQVTGADGIAMSRIAFVSRHAGGKEVYLMDYDGARVRRLTTTGEINLVPAWSPDARELAYLSYRGDQPGIYVMDDEGGLGSLPTIDAPLSMAPEWSPDGRKLVYAADVQGTGNMDLYVIDRATGRNTQLTRHPLIDSAPAWSPNSREIAFTSDRSGAPQIYLMDAEGLNQRRISWTGNYNDSAAWSPSGDRMAYVSRIEGRFQIMVMDMATEKVTQLTAQGNNENPRWSPDGRHLVFSSDRSGSYDIYTMRDDGSGDRRLTRNGDCYTPDWGGS